MLVLEIFISVNHLREKIMDYFKDGKDIGIDINYLVEDQPLGTALTKISPIIH